MTIKEVSMKYGVPAETLRYYERVGVIPPITRTTGGIRNYSEEDIKWVQHAKCMRDAGVSVEALVEYLRLYIEGDSTFEDRLHLLSEQRDVLLAKKKQLEESINKMNYKISRYEEAVRTGQLIWTENTNGETKNG